MSAASVIGLVLRAFPFQMESFETGKKALIFELERDGRRNRHPLSAVTL